MCGFVGLISKDLITRRDRSVVMAMNKLIRHRGPDNEAYSQSDFFTCGSSRLSIIDLNERSNQPMIDQTGRFTLIFNGEIYNYREVRSELETLGHKFSTSSDTEVVLISFIEWGIDCVNKFIGMFAFVIFDALTRESFIFRDQLGIKPLYFCIHKKKLYFASEIKAFSAVLDLKANYEKFGEYSMFGSISGSQTLFKEIFTLLPGHFMSVNHEVSYKIHQYFDIRESFYKQKSSGSLDELEALLKDSILKHTRSDVDYGAQLSGGLDSSYVVAETALHKPRLETFSVGLEGYESLDESRYQTMCSDRFKTVHHSYYFKSEDFCNYLTKSIWFFDYPLHHPNIVPIHILCQKAKEKGLKVLLSGDGADELFCGYKWYFEKENSSKDKINNLIFASAYNSPKNISGSLSIANFNLDERKNIIKDIRDDTIAKLILDQNYYLQKWLQRQDRMGMSSSVEIRVPYCNVQIAELMNSMTTSHKTKSLEKPKLLLKMIAEKYLPKELVWRNKIGFGIPLEDWFRQSGGLNSFIKYLKDDRFKDRQIYNLSFVDKLISDHLSAKANNGRILWTLLNIELWHRIFIDKSIDPLALN